MNKLAILTLLLLFRAHTAVLTVPQVNGLLDVSCLIRAKEAIPTETGPKKGLIGCSGTFVAPNRVLTAAHCFEYPAERIWVKGHDKTGSHSAQLVKCDVSHDLALLQVAGPEHVSAKIAKSIRLGETVINVGSPFSLNFLLSEGLVASLRVPMHNFKSVYTVTTAMINSGSSGGGAFNNKWELLGVNTMTVGGPFGWAGVSLAVSLEDVKEFLR